MSRLVLVMLAAYALAGAVHAADRASVRITVSSDVNDDIDDRGSTRRHGHNAHGSGGIHWHRAGPVRRS